MTIPGNLLTTAMAVMPHTNVDQALKAALSLDVPFWPQLPNYDYHEDMYVQVAEHFPGIFLDIEKKTLRFSMYKFIAQFEETMTHFEKENLDLLSFKLKGIWKALEKKGIPIDQILDKSMLSPATCCLINQDKEKTVEKAFRFTNMLSQNLREYYKLI